MSDQTEEANAESVSRSASCAQAEHTPGPYQKGVTSARDRVILTVHRDDGKAHGDLYSVRHPVEGQEPVANLRLAEKAFNAAQEAKEMGCDPIAAMEALPELLHVLRDISGNVDTLNRSQMVDLAERALASAEGEP